jgi:hypothetical protein
MSIKVVHRDTAYGLIAMADEPAKKFYFVFNRQWFDNGAFNQEWYPMKGTHQTLRLTATSGTWQAGATGIRFIGLGGKGTIFSAFANISGDILRFLAVESCNGPKVLKCDGLIAIGYEDLKVALYAPAAVDCDKLLEV